MLLLLQIAAIVGLARTVRWLFSALKQPAVIAEMVAGVMLGPSCLGWLQPQWFAALFPQSSLGALNALSQLGLVLYMFLVGRRVSAHTGTSKTSSLAIISAVSIAVPFAAGSSLGVLLHRQFAPAGVDRLPFALFIGAAMSITAFPVLARILTEHRLIDTAIGRLAIACAAFDDVTGWLILAAILSSARSGADAGLVRQIVGLAIYLVVMVAVIRPALAWVARRRGSPIDSSVDGLGLVLLLVLVSAAVTEMIGVHALFGAFFAGVMMPRTEDRAASMADSIEPVTVAVLLPLFFAFTGLRTRLQLIDSPEVILVTAGILATAIAGKGLASTLAARATGLDWRSGWALGALLNTRGLIELVILNIGLEAGILSPVVFSMFVVMTFVTTLMTSPLLTALGGRRSFPQIFTT